MPTIFASRSGESIITSANGYGDGRREHVVGKLAGVVSAARSSMEFGAGGGVLSWGFKVEAGAGDCCAAMAIF